MTDAIFWALAGLVSSGAVLLGVRRHRPVRSGVWWLLGSAIVAMAAGDVSYAIGAGVLAEVCYLSMFPLVAVGMIQLTRGGAVLADRAQLIDLLALTCATALIGWVFVVGPEDTARSLAAAHALGDVLLVVVAARLVMAAGRNYSAVLLSVGAIGLLIGDVSYPLAPGHPAETGYLVLYLAWGAAAMHPSMARLTAPAASRPSPWPGHRAVLLAGSVAAPPVVLLVEALSGRVGDGPVIAVAAGCTITLTITRLTDAIGQYRRALVRERGLREAGAALVAAVATEEVEAAVRAAAATLLPHGVEHLVQIVDEAPRPAAPPTGRATFPRSWWLDRPLPGTEGRPGLDATLVCPFLADPLSVARPLGGALLLSARRSALHAVRDAVEVLASQAVLALDRIVLVEAIGRRDSDSYLQAVIRHTEGIILVADEDGRIRYASPALASTLGVRSPPLATLRDLVWPADHRHVERTLRDVDPDRSAGASWILRRTDGRRISVEVTVRDLRQDRLVRGFVITIQDPAGGQRPRRRTGDASDRRPAGRPGRRARRFPRR